MRGFIFLIAAAMACRAQWVLQQSNTNSDLRGIHSLSQSVAWASGTNGAVLRTTDGGSTWLVCAIPPGAEHLDFRGIQAIGEHSAVVMSSGPGALSRVYATQDGCRSWELLITNPEADGFWDAILYDSGSRKISLLGDPVNGGFAVYTRTGRTWRRHSLPAVSGQAAFAASNSILIGYQKHLCFVTGGTKAEFVCGQRRPLPFAEGQSSGAFSVAAREHNVVVVGGDYKIQKERQGTAAYSEDSGRTFAAARTMPDGYRSAVSYDNAHRFWIAVGPSGTDVSRNNGRDWSRLGKSHGTADADGNWNALSLPFAVGPHGRIGRLTVP